MKGRTGFQKRLSVKQSYGLWTVADTYRCRALVCGVERSPYSSECGCGQRGRRAEEPFKHDTGKGFVEARPGRAHNAYLVPFIVEATGGIARAGRAQVGLLARRATGKHARDRTQYGRARGSTRVFYLHHTRMITKAAVVRDATMIREQVQSLRQRVCTAHAGAGGVP